MCSPHEGKQPPSAAGPEYRLDGAAAVALLAGEEQRACSPDPAQQPYSVDTAGEEEVFSPEQGKHQPSVAAGPEYRVEGWMGVEGVEGMVAVAVVDF